jgi:two-component system phosphate regulon sensor histidine kinase PhoR
MRQLRPKRLLWRVFPAFLVLSIITLGAIAWYSTFYFERVVLARSTDTLHQEAAVIETLIRGQLISKQYANIDHILKQMSVSARSRFTVILPDGTVIADSLEPVSSLENHADRVEFNAALKTPLGVSQRYSRTRKERTLYVAIPVRQDGVILSVIRASISLESVKAATRTFYIQMLVACGFILLIVSIGCYWIYHWLTQPLEVLREGIERFSSGNLKHRLSVPESTEMAEITKAVNLMASQLDERFQSLQDEQREKETILTSLFDGILVVDCNEMIVNLNNIAADILGFTGNAGPGLKLSSHVRSSALIELVRKCSRDKQPSTREIVFRTHQEEFYQVDCIPIRESGFTYKKIVVVFHNITQSKRIQSARRDMITNVSHHLKFPVARIQELVSGIADTATLSAIGSESKLMVTILNDLIYLIQFEQLTENQQMEFAPISLRGMFNDAKDIMDELAAQKSITVTIEGDADAIANTSSLQQASLHLLKNAITYTPVSGTIRISLTNGPDYARIVIDDNGIGIPPEAVTHIFKPFYRINTPEHQQVKGGGLGLAIVKTIIDTHRGRIRVDSQFGYGTTFTIDLPSSSSGGSYVTPA